MAYREKTSPHMVGTNTKRSSPTNLKLIIRRVSEVSLNPEGLLANLQFSGKFGITKTQDKSAVGWDDHEKLQQHESQKDYKKGFGGWFWRIL